MIRVERRTHVPRWLSWLAPLAGVLLALVVGSAILALARIDPVEAYVAIARAGYFGGAYALSDTAVKATPLLLCGLACAVAFRANLWNVGAEGQLFLGAWAATGVATFWLPEDTARPLMLAVMAAAAMAAGGAWAAVPGVLRARWRVNEIISSLMLVYVAVRWNNYWIYGPWSDRGFQLTPRFPKTAWLPRLSDLAGEVSAFSGLTVHLGLVIALAAAAGIWVLLGRTGWGYGVRLLGANERAARYAGVPIRRRIVSVMVLSGALAGLAGMCEVAGVVHRLQEKFSPGYGFTAILVAWLARLNPWAVVVVAFLAGGLLVGGREVQPAGIPLMLQGVVLFSLLACEAAIRYRIVVERGPAAEEAR